MPSPAIAKNAPERHSRLKPLIQLAGIVPAAVALLVMLGWVAHIRLLVQLRPTLAPMQFNTALCILLSGAALWAWNRKWSRATTVAAGAVVLVSGLTLYEYMTGFYLGIDQLFFRTYITTETSHIGRMSPASAFCLFFIGSAMILAGLKAVLKWRMVVIGSMGSVVITVCAVALFGYAIDLPGTYGWGELSRIAPHTAVCLGIMGVGIFFLAWPVGWKAGEPMPHWLPVPVSLGVMAASLVFYQALQSGQNQEMVQAVKANGDAVSTALNLKVEARIRSLVRMAKRWEFAGRPERSVWEDDAKNYVKDFPDFQAIEWIDGAHSLRWIEPLAGNEAKIGQDLISEDRRWKAAKSAQQSRDSTVTRAVQLFRGGLGVIIYIPIYKGEQFDGWIAGVFKAQQMFDRYLPESVVPGYAISISDGEELYARDAGPKPGHEAWIYKSTMEMRGTTWTLNLWPTAAMTAKMDSALPEMALGGGLALGVLMGLCVYLAQNASVQVRKTRALNRELQSALDEVDALSGLLPICAGCKRIRDDSGYWNAIERYISKHSQASFSHGICPECALKFYEAEGMEVPEEVIKAAEQHNYD